LKFAGSWNQFFRDRLRLPQYLLSREIISNFQVNEEPFVFRWLYKHKHGRVIYNGLDLEQLRSLGPMKLTSRAKYRFVYAGRLAPQKGLVVALCAVAKLVEAGWDVHLTLFGSGAEPYVAELESKVDDLELSRHVTFYGECNSWQAFAGDAVALLFPSYGEGTSNVVLEALAVGLPVVVSDIAMSRELLKDEENAMIVSSHEASSWFCAIEKLLNDDDLRYRLSVAGRLVADKFSIENMVKCYGEVYQRLYLSNSEE